jgi:hypothetical protein
MPKTTTAIDIPVITRRLITCTQSRSVGKSSTAEALITWLNRVEIPYAALDADRLNQTLFRRYPANVKFHEAAKSESDFVRFLKAIPAQVPVTLVDFPSNATDVILEYAAHYGLPEYFAKIGIRPTFFIFAADDSAIKKSGSDTVRYFNEKADYILVENPAKFESAAFKRISLYKWLIDRQTPTVILPVIAAPSVEAWETLERKNKRWLSLDEACQSNELDDLSRGDLQYFRDKVLDQFDQIASSLVPDVNLLKNGARTLAGTPPPYVSPDTFHDDFLE